MAGRPARSLKDLARVLPDAAEPRFYLGPAFKAHARREGKVPRAFFADRLFAVGALERRRVCVADVAQGHGYAIIMAAVA